MTVEEMEDLFHKHHSEYHKFDRVSPKRSRRGDIHAFLLLDEILPSKWEPGHPSANIIGCAEHDEVFLSISPTDLAAVVTEAQILELVRCGVRVGMDSLCLFV